MMETGTSTLVTRQRGEISEFLITNGKLKKFREELKKACSESIFLKGTSKTEKLFRDNVVKFTVGLRNWTVIVEDDDERKTYQMEIEYVIAEYENSGFYEMDISTRDYQNLRVAFDKAIHKIGGIDALTPLE